MFDIVIPVGPNDTDIIATQIPYTQANVIGYRNIYLIGNVIIPGCVTIPESIFPFSIDTVVSYHGERSRNGWYLQQLLKLYAGFIIPNILDTYLVIDCDTFFLKPTSFINDGKCLYNFGTEHWKAYFVHMKKLNSTFERQLNKSGICHHMMFQTMYLQELFKTVEQEHNDFFYNVFLKFVTETDGSGASEYEIYFNYMILNHPTSIKLRPLNWANSQCLLKGYDYVSCHWYMR